MQDLDDGLRELASLNESLHDDHRDRNFQALGMLLSENIVLMPPGSPSLHGKDRVLMFWRRRRQIQDISLHSTDPVALGAGVMRDAGTFHMNSYDDSGATRTFTGKYASVWMRVASGWQLDCLMWNGVGDAERRRGAPGEGPGLGRRLPPRPKPFVSRTE